MPDLSPREWAAILPMIVLMVWMGIAPQTFLPSIGASDARTLEQSKVNVEIQVKNTQQQPAPAGSQEVASAQ